MKRRKGLACGVRVRIQITIAIVFLAWALACCSVAQGPTHSVCGTCMGLRVFAYVYHGPTHGCVKCEVYAYVCGPTHRVPWGISQSYVVVEADTYIVVCGSHVEVHACTSGIYGAHSNALSTLCFTSTCGTDGAPHIHVPWSRAITGHTAVASLCCPFWSHAGAVYTARLRADIGEVSTWQWGGVGLQWLPLARAPTQRTLASVACVLRADRRAPGWSLVRR